MTAPTARPQLTRDEMIRRVVAAAPPPTPEQIELVRRLVLPVTTQTRTLPTPLNTGGSAPRMRVPSQSRATHSAPPPPPLGTARLLPAAHTTG